MGSPIATSAPIEPRVVLIALTFVTAAVWFIFFSNARPKDFPPGPSGLPIIGNLLQIDQGLPYLTFEGMSKKYGPIIGLKLGTKNAVVLHDAGLVQDLIIKQGSSMASRPPRYVSQEHVMPEGKHIHPVFMRDDWAMKLRTITKDYMVGRGLLGLVPMAKAIGMRLVDAIHHSNGDWSDDLAEWALEVQTSQLTGAPVELFGRKYVHEYHEMTVALEDIMVSRAADIIPILRWVPAMFAEWKRRAPIVRKQVLKAYTQLVTVTKTHHAGSYEGLIPKLLSQSVDPVTEPSHRMTEMEITMMMGGLLDAGFASTVATFETIILVLTKHPEVLRKAQAEIDEVFGKGADHALPNTIDRNQLPYLHAVVIEVLRWHPTTPIILPRETEEDTKVRGYRIPKGTTIMTNVWTIQHDPEFYDDPESFNPERYMRHPLGIKDGAPSLNRKAVYTFGFGRRECPGKDFFFQQMELVMSQVIWAFDFKPTGPLDTDPRTGFIFGVASRPKKLNVEFVPRRSNENIATEKRKADIALHEILGI